MLNKVKISESRLAIVLGLGLFVSVSMFANGPDTLWTRTFGGIDVDEAYSVQQTQDGGYIIAGRTYSHGADSDDVYLIKTDANGDTLWTKTFGGGNYDRGFSVQQTKDGGYIIAGCTQSYGAGYYWDVYLIKTDANGDTLWTKTYGGWSDDWGNSVQQTQDGGYIIAGYSAGDVYLIKTDANGDTLWTRTFGGPDYDYGNSVQQTQDGGYIIAGRTDSYGAGYYDVYLIKTDSLGDTLWTKTYGGSDYDASFSVQQTLDGGYIIAGYTKSYGAGYYDVYLIKTDSLGDTLWTRTFGGSDEDEAYSVQQTQDGGYIIAGRTYSYGAGNYDVWLIKTDANGDTLWTRTFGGGSYDRGFSVQQTKDGGYIIAGRTESYGAGGSDVWLIKINPVKLISPDGGEAWAGGSYHNIIWHCEDTTVVDHCRLLYSTDGGSSYPDTIAQNIPNTDTSYLWTLPPINSTTCRVKIQILDSLNNVVSEDESDADFTISPSGIEETATLTPKTFFISQNFPNPFTGITRIRYGVPGDVDVNISVYNLLGQKVATLVNGNKKAGYYTVTWDGSKLSAGIYFIRFKAGEYNKTLKAMLMK